MSSLQYELFFPEAVIHFQHALYLGDLQDNLSRVIWLNHHFSFADETFFQSINAHIQGLTPYWVTMVLGVLRKQISVCQLCLQRTCRSFKGAFAEIVGLEWGLTFCTSKQLLADDNHADSEEHTLGGKDVENTEINLEVRNSGWFFWCYIYQISTGRDVSNST